MPLYFQCTRNQRDPEKVTPCKKNTSYDTQIVKTGPPAFCTAHPFTQPPKSLNAFQSARHPKSPPSHGAPTVYTPCNTCSLDPPDSPSQTASQSVQPFLHNSRQSPYTLQCALKHN